MTTQTPTREMYLRPTAFVVASESKPDVTYRVTLPDCECPDFKFRKSSKPGSLCKHLRAAFTAAGWKVPGGNTGLDEATAVELLADFQVSASAAGAAVRRARQAIRSTIALPTLGIVVITYDRSHDRYDVELPG
jgi:hypothetical protein